MVCETFCSATFPDSTVELIVVGLVEKVSSGGGQQLGVGALPVTMLHVHGLQHLLETKAGRGGTVKIPRGSKLFHILPLQFVSARV